MKRKSDTTMMKRKHLKNSSVRLLALAAAGLLLVSGLTACGASASKSAYVSETMAAASGGMYNEAAAEEAVADYDSAAENKTGKRQKFFMARKIDDRMFDVGTKYTDQHKDSDTHYGRHVLSADAPAKHTHQSADKYQTVVAGCFIKLTSQMHGRNKRSAARKIDHDLCQRSSPTPKIKQQCTQ